MMLEDSRAYLAAVQGELAKQDGIRLEKVVCCLWLLQGG